MCSNNTFATTPTATTMDTRDTLLAKLGSTSLDNLHKILVAIRLRHATTEDNNKDDPSNHEANQAMASPPEHDTPQDQPTAPKNPDHTGIFAQAYVRNTLAKSHAKLYADFNAVDPSDFHQYMQELSKIDVT